MNPEKYGLKNIYMHLNIFGSKSHTNRSYQISIYLSICITSIAKIYIENTSTKHFSMIFPLSELMYAKEIQEKLHSIFACVEQLVGYISSWFQLTNALPGKKIVQKRNFWMAFHDFSKICLIVIRLTSAHIQSQK